MRLHKHPSLLFLSLLTACAWGPAKVPATQTAAHGPAPAHRSLAAISEQIGNPALLRARAERLMDGIFHAYLIGQVHLYSFDAELEKNPGEAMKSDAYGTLLAVRSFVDRFEHDFNDLYIDLVTVTALPEFPVEQRTDAQLALDEIGKFYDGLDTPTGRIPENLRPLILTNQREQQTELFNTLKDLRDKETDPEVKQVLRKNMVLLRATRKAFFQDMRNYKVDPEVLKQTLREEKKKTSFKQLEKDVKVLSKQMKALLSELGRGTGADTIYPSAGTNGNISGKNFPTNTWSLTYDDGPARTTDQILVNLKDRDQLASFFVLAKQVEANPALSKRVKDGGHEIALHSYTHQQLTKVSPPQLEREIGTAKKVVEEQLDVKIKNFRLPYGAGVSVSNVREKIAEHDMVHIFWTVDTLDWQDKNPQSIYERTLRQMRASSKNSGIILFHDIHQQSVIASTMVMDYLKRERLTVCTIEGVINQINNNLPSCK
jgi:peptidoglycan/xylan/chitin deacetylase (PgdA/CDA1 family)